MLDDLQRIHKPELYLALGFILALMLNSGLRGMGFYRMIYFMPVVTSIVAAAMVFQFLLNRDSGVLTAYMWWGVEKLFEYDYVLNNEGVAEFVRTYLTPPDWLNDPNWAKPGVILLTLWKNVGFTMVIYLAALQGIPQTLYEAAEVDGKALRWRIEHAQHLHPDDIGRFSALSVIASMQNVHCTSDGPWVPQRLGDERSD